METQTLEEKEQQSMVDIDMIEAPEFVEEEQDNGKEKDVGAEKEAEIDNVEEKEGGDVEIAEAEQVKEESEGKAEEKSEHEDVDGGKKVNRNPRKRSSAKTSKSLSSDKAEDESSKEPVTPLERPTRERKTVERYSAPQLSKSATKVFSIEQGKGTHLKDIPNVAYKLSKRKVDDNLKILHSILFGKKTKTYNLKKNIGMFSGFVWIENEEKQKGKIKEKLDKCVREKLLDFCDVLNISVKNSRKKEELSIKLLEFLEAPQATTDILLAEKQKSKKRKPAKRSHDRPSKKKKETETGDKEEQVPEEEEDDVDKEHEDDVSVPLDNKSDSEGQSEDEKEKEKANDQQSDEGTMSKDKEEGEDDEEEEDEEKPQKKVSSEKKSTKKSMKESGSKGDKDDKSANFPKKSTSVTKKKRASDSGEASGSVASKLKVSGRKSKKVEEKERPVKEKGKSSSKDQVKGRGKSGKKSRPQPSREDIHSVVVDTLKEVDFNTVTLADIIKLLGKHFEVDLMNRKAEMKEIITEVINDMSSDEEDVEEEANSADVKDDDDGKNN